MPILETLDMISQRHMTRQQKYVWIYIHNYASLLLSMYKLIETII